MHYEHYSDHCPLSLDPFACITHTLSSCSSLFVLTQADWSRGRPVSAGSTPNRHVSYRSSAFLSDTNRFSSGVGSSLVSRQQLETPGPGKQL